jgi:ABC-type oligopeptide transport system substrate-binding subunit
MKMKKAIISILIAVAVCFAQTASLQAIDTSKAAMQKTQLKKVVNVLPRTSTNWSKIKDLFR